MAKSRGSAAKSSSRRCLTRVRVTAPTAPRTPLPTKFAVAEKHTWTSPGDDFLRGEGLHLLARKAKGFSAGAGSGENRLCSAAKMEYGILLGRDSYAVPRGGMKVPAVERCQRSFVELGSHALKHRFLHNFSTFVNRDLDHHVALCIRQFPRVGYGIHGLNGKGRPNLVACRRPADEGSVGRSRERAVPLSGKRLRLRLIFAFVRRKWDV